MLINNLFHLKPEPFEVSKSINESTNGWFELIDFVFDLGVTSIERLNQEYPELKEHNPNHFQLFLSYKMEYDQWTATISHEGEPILHLVPEKYQIEQIIQENSIEFLFNMLKESERNYIDVRFNYEFNPSTNEFEINNINPISPAFEFINQTPFPIISTLTTPIWDFVQKQQITSISPRENQIVPTQIPCPCCDQNLLEVGFQEDVSIIYSIDNNDNFKITDLAFCHSDYNFTTGCCGEDLSDEIYNYFKIEESCSRLYTQNK